MDKYICTYGIYNQLIQTHSLASMTKHTYNLSNTTILIHCQFKYGRKIVPEVCMIVIDYHTLPSTDCTNHSWVSMYSKSCALHWSNFFPPKIHLHILNNTDNNMDTSSNSVNHSGCQKVN